MLTLNKLEKVMELEEQLRGEYQSQLEAKDAEIERLNSLQAELQETIDGHQATIDKQLATIRELTSASSDTQRVEQLNRELSNRSENLASELAELKKRTKTLQKDLAEVRAENKSLLQYDPPRMKKNLDANKKKLAEKTRANDLLQKSVSKGRTENAELQQKIVELEAKLADLEQAAEPADATAADDVAPEAAATGEAATGEAATGEAVPKQSATEEAAA
jgi:chromosome segregation ATPase